MCMKYVNVSMECFESISGHIERPLAFNKPFDEIIAKKNDKGQYCTGNFVIVTHINILGTADESKQDSHILYNKDSKLDFVIRLTKCDKDPEKRFFYDIDSFCLDINRLRNNELVDEACFDFVNYARITDIASLELIKNGYYVIKMLVKKQTDDEYTVQYIKKMNIR